MTPRDSWDYDNAAQITMADLTIDVQKRHAAVHASNNGRRGANTGLSRGMMRRALFQIHLWSGIAVGLYVLMISVTGSVVVYSNELYRAATPAPIISMPMRR